MEPGLLALAMARTLSATNKELKSTLAPMIDTLRDMTKRSLAGAAEARAATRDEAGMNLPTE